MGFIVRCWPPLSLCHRRTGPASCANACPTGRHARLNTMTAPGGGGPYGDQPGPWQPYQHPPVDPQAPVNYPEYPYPQPYGSYPPPPPPYGYPSPPPYP